MFANFEDVQNFLDSLGLFHMDLSLNRMHAALRALNLIERLPYTVQVLGTNGKGSTSTFLASIAEAHGVRTGLYTSPHFVTPRERIRIHGQLLDEVRWPDLANRVHAAAPELTYFEFLTVVAVLAFVEDGVDLMVLEAGMGGLHDATTAIPANGACFAPIDLDHTKILGETIAAIAEDKAAAMRPGCFALTGPQPDEAMNVLRRVAEEKGARLLLADSIADLSPFCCLGLAGPHQRQNALIALAAYVLSAREKNWPVCPGSISKGLASARIAGRFQYVPQQGADPAFVLDGGHNPHGLRACKTALEEAAWRPPALIFSCLADKDMDHMLPLVCDMAGNAPILTPTIQDNERAMDGNELAQKLRDMGCRAEGMPRLALALQEAGRWRDAETPVLVCGSLYLLGEFFTLRPQWL